MRMATKILMELNQSPLTIQSPSSSPSPNDNIFNQILMQLNKWLALLPNLIHSLVAKFNDAFPPEARTHWLSVLPPWAIAALGVVLLLFCCCCFRAVIRCIAGVARGCWNCIKGLFMMLWRMCKKVFRCVCCCCGNNRSSSVKMMKAPGTRGALFIPRSAFESDPQAYFADLHAGLLV